MTENKEIRLKKETFLKNYITCYGKVIYPIKPKLPKPKSGFNTKKAVLQKRIWLNFL